MVSFSKSFVDFLKKSQSRVAKVLYTCEVWKDHRVVSRSLTNKEVDYLTFRSDGTISYLPAGKEHIVNEDGRWSRDNRQNGKPSKIIRKIFTPQALKMFSDKDFEQFANHYKASGAKDLVRFDIHDNYQIPDVYCASIEDGDGSLNNSCMNGDRDYIEFYTHIKGLQILALYNNDDELCGRALLWDIGNGQKFMDRVYVTKEHYYDLFLDKALENKWHRKVSYKSYDNKRRMTIDGVNTFDATFSFKYVETEYFPYIDTFCYGDDSFITNSCSSYIYEYNNTDGTRDGDNEETDDVFDDVNSRWISREDSVYIERGRYSGCYTHEDNATTVNGYTYWEDDDLIIWLDDAYYLKDDCHLIDDEWVHEDDAVHCEHDDKYYKREDCVELSDGTWCLESDAVEIDGKLYHQSNQTIPC